ncbi:transposase [Rhodococcus opacus PD630]|nr:transposase [Rhodococcus opacus PD630]
MCVALVAIDSISVLAHQHAAGLPAAGPTVSESNCTIASEPADHALGSSRGGWTTKIRALVDGTCPPVAVLLTAGQVGDNPRLAPLLEIYPDRHGCTMRLLAGKAYSHPSPRKLLRTKHISHTIPERSDQIARRKEKGSRGGRPPAFDVALYRHRNTVERGFNRLEHWRGVATRYDEYAITYLGGILLASTVTPHRLRN